MPKRLYRCWFDEFYPGSDKENPEWRNYGLALNVVSSGDAFVAGREALELAFEKQEKKQPGLEAPRLRSVEVISTIDE